MITVKLILQDYKNNGKMEKIDFRIKQGYTMLFLLL